ncbi:hypothetical protein GCM10028819_36850 [Spirosoma humi]
MMKVKDLSTNSSKLLYFFSAINDDNLGITTVFSAEKIPKIIVYNLRAVV